jgi:L-threonylcarbamoyladenylate synthase
MVSEHDISEAVAVLRRGGLVAFPTETVYGLGCDARNPDALRRLYAVKRRPVDHPVIVHLPSADHLGTWASAVPDAARVLAEACWPGPLTVVVPRAAFVPDGVTGGRAGVALRVPDQPVALALLQAFDGGVAAPSANRFGRVSPTSAQDVREDLDGDVDVVLDGGPCRVGVESTIVDCTGPEAVIVRVGGYPKERVERLLGHPVELRVDGERAAPGTLPIHYSPDASVVMVGRGELVAEAEAMLATGKRAGLLALDPPTSLPSGLVVLDAPADIDDFARVLYARLREADRLGLDVLFAVVPPSCGIGAAVGDRLRRAAGRSVS